MSCDVWEVRHTPVRVYVQLVCVFVINGSAHCSGCVVDGPSSMDAT